MLGGDNVVSVFATFTHNIIEGFKMVKDARFVVRINSRRDATLFYNGVQKQLSKERSCDGFTEYECANHWKGAGGLILTVHFKDLPCQWKRQGGFPRGMTLSGDCFRLLIRLTI